MTYEEFLEVNHLTDTELVRLAYDLCASEEKKDENEKNE